MTSPITYRPSAPIQPSRAPQPKPEETATPGGQQ